MDLIFSSSDESDEDFQQPPAKKKTYYPRINFNRQLDEFRARFRLTRAAVERIIQDIGHQLEHDTDHNMALTPNQQLCLALRYLGGGGIMLTIGDGHGPAKSTVSRSLHAVVEAINDHYFNEIVKWPENIEDVVAGFYKIARIPSCIGVIDGSHVPIKKPAVDEHQYVNRYGGHIKHSINTMMVSGPKYQFFYLSAKRPGNCSDQRVLRLSTLAHRFDRDNWRPLPKAILLGDSGYQLREWLITPILGINTTDAEEEFNRRQKKTRRIVECSFGILKKRYACLEKLRLPSPEFSAAVIKTCVILHNISISYQPLDQDEINEIMREIEEREGLHLNEEQIRLDGATDVAGLRRRAELVNMIEYND